MVKTLVLFLVCICFICASDQRGIDRFPLDQIEMVEQILTEKEELQVRQYDELRKETLHAIKSLEEQKQELQIKIHRSSGERKQELEKQLVKLTSHIERAEHQLQVINKEKMQAQALYLFSVRNPLYHPSNVLEKSMETYEWVKNRGDSIKKESAILIKSFREKNQTWNLLSLGVTLSMLGALYFISRRKLEQWSKLSMKEFSRLGLFVIQGVIETLFVAAILISLLGILHIDMGNLFTLKVLLASFLVMRWVSWVPSKKIKRALWICIPLMGINFLLHHFDPEGSWALIPIFALQITIGALLMNMAKLLKISSVKKAMFDLLLMASPLAIFFGLFSLSQYIFEAMILTIFGLGVLRMSHKALVRGIDRLFTPTQIGFVKISIPEKSQKLVKHWTRVSLLFLMGLSFSYFILIVWGVDRTFVHDSMRMLFFGVKIGSYTFSLIHLMIGLIVFSITLICTRYFQVALQKHVFPYTNIDVSLHHTLTKTTGYIGIAIAFLLGINAMGINISSLFFVLGGLSVGIGLGLQQIVMNFLSGVVMLIERPIKIDDIVDIDGDSGVVKTINVRTTEIEMSDKSIVILPNSHLINNMIKNWTKQNRMRRSEIEVKVVKESDPKFVSDVFLGALMSAQYILKSPSPRVLFQEIVEGGNLFVIQYYIGEAGDKDTILSKVHHLISKAASENGIVFAHHHFDFELLTKGLEST
jgi:small-conductance mechanosensitive channel